MERKIHFGADVKMAETDHGWLEGYGSVFGNVDSDRDVVVKGAFAATLPDFVRDGFMPVGHNWTGLAVATIEEASEDDHGLYLRAHFHSTPEAQNARTVARERMERGKSVGLSIGYRVPQGGAKQGPGGVRLIERAELFEVSIVTVPANALAVVTGTKQRTDWRALADPDIHTLLLDHSSQARDAIEEIKARAQGRHETRLKEGRTLSAANRTQLGAHLAELRRLSDEIEALLDATDPQKADGQKAALLAAVMEAEIIIARQYGVAV